MQQNTAIREMDRLQAAATRIVCAYVGNADLTTVELVETIGSIMVALKNAAHGSFETSGRNSIPAVPITQSVTANFIVCLEDGKKLKMLKRHLMSKFGLTPAQYRARWNLPADYPMVASTHLARMSAGAKTRAFGKQRRRLTARSVGA